MMNKATKTKETKKYEEIMPKSVSFTENRLIETKYRQMNSKQQQKIV